MPCSDHPLAHLHGKESGRGGRVRLQPGSIERVQGSLATPAHERRACPPRIARPVAPETPSMRVCCQCPPSAPPEAPVPVASPSPHPATSRMAKSETSPRRGSNQDRRMKTSTPTVRREGRRATRSAEVYRLHPSAPLRIKGRDDLSQRATQLGDQEIGPQFGARHRNIGGLKARGPRHGESMGEERRTAPDDIEIQGPRSVPVGHANAPLLSLDMAQRRA